jgi:protein Tex
VVKAGDVVKVKVLEVDLKRKRVALTMRLQEASESHESRAGRTESSSAPKRHTDSSQAGKGKKPAASSSKTHKSPKSQPAQAQPMTAFGSALAEALANARKR